MLLLQVALQDKLFVDLWIFSDLLRRLLVAFLAIIDVNAAACQPVIVEHILALSSFVFRELRVIAERIPANLIISALRLIIQLLILVDLHLFMLVPFEVVEDLDLLVASVAYSDVLRQVLVVGVVFFAIDFEFDVLNCCFDGAVVAEVKAANNASMSLLKE